VAERRAEHEVVKHVFEQTVEISKLQMDRRRAGVSDATMIYILI
jgi:hypothetical protein